MELLIAPSRPSHYEERRYPRRVSVEKIFAEDVIEEVYDVSAMRSVKESWSASAVGPCVSAPGYAYSKTSILNKPPYKLSGGQKRLVALVAAVAHQPKLLLLDEPSTYLDAAVLVATHDAEFICRLRTSHTC